MNDLIHKEVAYEVLTDYYHHNTDIQHQALREALNRVPIEELIHCDQCKFYEISKNRVDGMCNYWDTSTLIFDYCSRGLRKDRIE